MLSNPATNLGCATDRLKCLWFRRRGVAWWWFSAAVRVAFVARREFVQQEALAGGFGAVFVAWVLEARGVLDAQAPRAKSVGGADDVGGEFDPVGEGFVLGEIDPGESADRVLEFGRVGVAPALGFDLGRYFMTAARVF